MKSRSDETLSLYVINQAANKVSSLRDLTDSIGVKCL